MAEQKFDEAEQYLLQNWAVATDVEDAIDGVRTKYEALCVRIAETVTDNHKKELDDEEVVAVLKIAGPARLKSGAIVLRRSSWPSNGKNSPTGFWVTNLRLEYLNDEDKAPPEIGFWLDWDDEKDDDVYSTVAKAIADAARKAFSSEQSSQWKPGDNEWTPLIGKVVASKEEIREMLSKNDTERFVDTIVNQLEELATLIPAIDEALRIKSAASGKT